MSTVRKWKTMIVSLLGYPFRVLGKYRGKGRDKGDRHGESDAGVHGGGSEAGGAKTALTRYYLLAGTYVVVVVALLVVTVMRFGGIPSLELPGAGKDPDRGAWQESQDDEDEESLEEDLPPSHTFSPAAEEEDVKEETADQKRPSAGPGEDGPGNVFLEEEAGSDADVALDKYVSLPQAASPLQQWSLYSPFRSYLSEELPSGGILHRLSKGVLLRAAPGTPASALWDGTVSAVTTRGLPYSRSLLIEHEGGYSTFYGNLKEIWVSVGDHVNRGEHIGVLPEAPSGAEEEQADAEYGGEDDENALSVAIQTIWSGYVKDKGGEPLPEGQGAEKNGPQNSFLPLSAFDGQNPLLYLEVRSAGSYIDPLKFIPARN